MGSGGWAHGLFNNRSEASPTGQYQDAEATINCTLTVLPSLPTTRPLFALQKCIAALEAIAPEKLTTRAISGRAIPVLRHLCLVGATRVQVVFKRDYERLRGTRYGARRGERECS